MRSRGLAALAGALVLVLAGCSGGGGPDQSAPTSNEAADSSTSGGDEGSSGDEDSSGTEDSGSDAGTSSSDTGGGVTPPDADLADTQFTVTAEDALSTSAEEVGGDGIMHAIELDYSESAGAWVWSVKTLVDGTDHEVEINADTGEVLDHEQEATDDQEQAVDLNSPMTWDDALGKARAEVDGPVSGWKLEWDDGMSAYQFDIASGSDETEVTVDVDSGEVTVDAD